MADRIDTIRTELNSDRGRYGALNSKSAADDMNMPRRTSALKTLDADMVLGLINDTEWAAALPATRDNIRDVLRIPNVTLVPGSRGRRLIEALGPSTRAALATTIAITISRAEELGVGTVTAGDIEQARV